MAGNFDVNIVFRNVLEKRDEFTKNDDSTIIFASIEKTPLEYRKDLAKEFHFSGTLRSLLLGKYYSCVLEVLRVSN